MNVKLYLELLNFVKDLKIREFLYKRFRYKIEIDVLRNVLNNNSVMILWRAGLFMCVVYLKCE